MSLDKDRICKEKDDLASFYRNLTQILPSNLHCDGSLPQITDAEADLIYESLGGLNIEIGSTQESCIFCNSDGSCMLADDVRPLECRFRSATIKSAFQEIFYSKLYNINGSSYTEDLNTMISRRIKDPNREGFYPGTINRFGYTAEAMGYGSQYSLIKKMGLVLSYIGYTPGDSYLDLGCGFGFFREMLPRDVSYTGVDLFADKYIKLVKERSIYKDLAELRPISKINDRQPFQFINSGIDEALDWLQTGMYDNILCIGVLQDYPDATMAYNIVKRILNKNPKKFVIITLSSKNERMKTLHPDWFYLDTEAILSNLKYDRYDAIVNEEVMPGHALIVFSSKSADKDYDIFDLLDKYGYVAHNLLFNPGFLNATLSKYDSYVRQYISEREVLSFIHNQIPKDIFAVQQGAFRAIRTYEKLGLIAKGTFYGILEMLCQRCTLDYDGLIYNSSSSNQVSAPSQYHEERVPDVPYDPNRKMPVYSEIVVKDDNPWNFMSIRSKHLEDAKKMHEILSSGFYTKGELLNIGVPEGAFVYAITTYYEGKVPGWIVQYRKRGSATELHVEKKSLNKPEIKQDEIFSEKGDETNEEVQE